MDVGNVLASRGGVEELGRGEAGWVPAPRAAARGLRRTKPQGHQLPSRPPAWGLLVGSSAGGGAESLLP